MEISEINIYPVKSLGGISLPEAVVEERGLRYDRRWLLVDEKGGFLTQREHPLMATLRVSLDDDRLRVSDSESASIEIPFAADSPEQKSVKIWSSRVRADLYSEEINRWFAERLGLVCRLAVMPEAARRKVNPFYAVRRFKDVVSFADGYPVLLIGEDSLADLNARLETPVPMNRFRPNLVVRDSGAFAEDGWKKIDVAGSVFHLVKPCARCVMTTIDQASGQFQGKEPLKTLAAYRTVKSGGRANVNFGQNLIAEKFGGTVRLGDRVEILETR